jgi:hypothetical protein
VTSEVQLSEPASELLRVARAVTATWLRRRVLAAAGDLDLGLTASEFDAFVDVQSTRLLDALEVLLTTDVDEQRSTPLSLYRNAVVDPTDLLRTAGVPARVHDRFTSEAFPDDLYGLGPATWADIDPAMHEPGLAWGAWKAMTVLQRRRGEGLR